MAGCEVRFEPRRFDPHHGNFAIPNFHHPVQPLCVEAGIEGFEFNAAIERTETLLLTEHGR